ncbi:MAG TPA: metallophosphoesterase [Jatrophihabitans sp.]|nr:metallophosphoesterase [Jatrophihabitans sp.]
MTEPPTLFAVSDLHVGYEANRAVVAEIKPRTPHDWLIVAGDVGERAESILATLSELAGRFEQVIWAPGNHELWTHPSDPLSLRGVERYQYLVDGCRAAGVLTPEDEYPVWPYAAEPVVIAPLFLLYDYSFLPPGVHTQADALALAYRTGVVCTDEKFLHPDPYPSRQDWCAARVAYSRRRLDQLDAATVLINHWPLTRLPTEVLRFPQFAQWCGTTATADWHVHYRAAAVVYGHLHIPRVTHEDGVRFDEVSLGYPREWQPRQRRLDWPRPIQL